MLAIRNKVLEEIHLLPEDKLKEIYDLIHFFRLGLQKGKSKDKSKSIMNYAGIWEDMPEEEFNDFSKEVEMRRKNAFISRSGFETSIDR